MFETAVSSFLIQGVFFILLRQMKTSYYKRMQFFTSNPLWRRYLSWAYQCCVDDLKKIGYQPDFTKDNFTALLSGTSGETTSMQFAKFVFDKNPNAKIIILDIVPEQLERSRAVLSINYPDKNIEHILSDAKQTPLESDSIDYIETDGFLEYFLGEDLRSLLKEWSRILRQDGFITTRAFATNSVLGRLADKLRLFSARRVLGVTVYAHSKQELIQCFQDAGFEFVKGGNTFIPTLYRFSLVNRK